MLYLHLVAAHLFWCFFLFCSSSLGEATEITRTSTWECLCVRLAKGIEIEFEKMFGLMM